MAEISRLMGVAPSTLVYVVDGLTKKKLVKRGKDPKDRRRGAAANSKKRGRICSPGSLKMDARAAQLVEKPGEHAGIQAPRIAGSS